MEGFFFLDQFKTRSSYYRNMSGFSQAGWNEKGVKISGQKLWHLGGKVSDRNNWKVIDTQYSKKSGTMDSSKSNICILVKIV